MSTFKKFTQKLEILEVLKSNYNKETFEKHKKFYGKGYDLLSIGFQKYHYDSYELISKYPRDLQKFVSYYEKKELKKINFECKNYDKNLKKITSIEDENYYKDKYEVNLLDQLINRISTALECLNSLDENQRNLILKDYKKYEKGAGFWDLFLSKFSKSKENKVKHIENLKNNYNQALFGKEKNSNWIKKRAEELISKRSYGPISKILELNSKVNRLEEEENQFKKSVYEIKSLTNQEKELFIKDALKKNKGNRFIVDFSLMQYPLKEVIAKKILEGIKFRNLKQQFNEKYPPKKLKRSTSLFSYLNNNTQIRDVRRSSSLSL